MTVAPLAPERRSALAALLDLRSPGDALAAYYALHHPPARTALWVQEDSPGRTSGFLVRAQTGRDLFRPLVVLRAASPEAAGRLLQAALPAGQSAIFSLTETIGRWPLPITPASARHSLDLYRLSPARFECIVNIFVQSTRSPDGLPRYEIRNESGLLAAAGVNWQSAQFAEIFAQVEEGVRHRGYGKSVVAALCNQLLQENRSVLYAVEPDNRDSVALAESVGFERTLHREVWIEGVCNAPPRPGARIERSA